MQKFPLAGVITVLALCFLSVLYGSIAVYMNWWPAGTVRDAKLALEALSGVADEELRRNWPASMESVEPSGALLPFTVEHVAQGEDTLIFVDGGMQQLRSHCPANGCIAWVTNRRGDILHVWDIGDTLLWEDLQTVEGFSRGSNIYSVGAQPFPNGDLVVTYQGRNTYPYGVGIARFDKDSNLLWRLENNSHHWLSVDGQGRIYTSVFRPRPAPVAVGGKRLQISCRGGQVYEDVIVILDADGTELDSFSLLDAFVDSGYTGLVYQGKYPDTGLPVNYEECDPTHLNDVRVISAADAATSELLEAGDLLVTLRSNNLVAVIDPVSRRIRWVSAGRVVLPHSPRYLGDGTVLVFDNLGGEAANGGSRLRRIDMLTDEAETVFPPADGSVTDFFSETAGMISVNAARDRALVSLTRQGRTLEIDLASGELLWEYHNTHDVRGLAQDAEGNEIISGRFATQTVSYFEDAAFEFNGGEPR